MDHDWQQLFAEYLRDVGISICNFEKLKTKVK